MPCDSVFDIAIAYLIPHDIDAWYDNDTLRRVVPSPRVLVIISSALQLASAELPATPELDMETGKAENTSNVFYMALSCMDNYGITSTILYLSVVLFHCVPRSVADKFHTSAENLLIILLLARPEPHPHSLSALKYFSSTFPVDTHDNTLLHAALIASYRADRKWRLGAIPIVAKLVRKWSRVGLLL